MAEQGQSFSFAQNSSSTAPPADELLILGAESGEQRVGLFHRAGRHQDGSANVEVGVAGAGEPRIAGTDSP
jgi:hypothetical protein